VYFRGIRQEKNRAARKYIGFFGDSAYQLFCREALRWVRWPGKTRSSCAWACHPWVPGLLCHHPVAHALRRSVSRNPFDFSRAGAIMVTVLASVREYFRSEGVVRLICASADWVRSRADGAVPLGVRAAGIPR
jgi:hypothetical protein